MANKQVVALLCFVLLVGLAVALREDSHNKANKADSSYKPVQDVESDPIFYAIAKTQEDNRELNRKSVLVIATYKVNILNHTLYNLTFKTYGVTTSYKYDSPPEDNWPEVMAAITYIADKYRSCQSLPYGLLHLGSQGRKFDHHFWWCGTNKRNM